MKGMKESRLNDAAQLGGGDTNATPSIYSKISHAYEPIFVTVVAPSKHQNYVIYKN